MGRKECQPVCKPGSVWLGVTQRGGHSSGTLVAERLTRPTRTARPETGHRPYAVLLPAGFAMPRPLPSARWALTPPFHPYRRPEGAGGLFSVALSLGLPPPGVTRRRVSVEPGLSSPAAFRLMLERPPDRLARPMWPAGAPKATRAASPRRERSSSRFARTWTGNEKGARRNGQTPVEGGARR